MLGTTESGIKSRIQFNLLASLLAGIDKATSIFLLSTLDFHSLFLGRFVHGEVVVAGIRDREVDFGQVLRAAFRGLTHSDCEVYYEKISAIRRQPLNSLTVTFRGEIVRIGRQVPGSSLD